ncbi:DUF58 domain-containing protein [Photobacterium halotolerans]|uniref:DUF58 domain-containing protein n=1 Tax=Photobacterium halotolerans TaxID=265726 RepID=A0A0F5VGQ7_9GAMM|nr:DUF58 domain-containing protein [Photobacterium halotolerans]KKD01299.1 hypothetical protein KY46_00190 [Photobacterium halotolerans]
MADPLLDSRLYCQPARMAALQVQAEQLSSPSMLKIHSILSGRHSANFRGRGLNFEELRHYRKGDDIRQLDWRVTLRTGEPYVRVYTEEKDHHVTLCVDQRASMFFSSVDTMKSVVAAEIAALIGWSVVKKNDRVGLAIFGEARLTDPRPTRMQSEFLTQLHRLCEVNQSLSVASSTSGQNQLDAMLTRLMARKERNALVVILSDFYQCNAACIQKLQHLQRRGHVLCIAINDPLEQSFASAEAWVVSDGDLQMNIEPGEKSQAVVRHLTALYQARKETLSKIMAMKRLPLIELDTSGGHIRQFRQALENA